MPVEKKPDGIEFLQKYLLKHKCDKDRVDAAFDCVRHNFPESLEVTLLSFLDIQPSFEIFSNKLDNQFYTDECKHFCGWYPI